MILLGDDGDDHPKIPAILVGVIRAGDAKPPSEKVLRGGPSYDFFVEALETWSMKAWTW